MVALVDVTSFPALNTGYFSGTYALWLLLPFVGGLALAEALPPAAPPAPDAPEVR
jgi:hypothetical protein